MLSKVFEDPSTKKLARDVAEFVLKSQRIASHTKAGDAFAVVVGSGMGLVHSGEVSYGSYYSIAKARFLHTYRDRYGLQAYLRYRDDILVKGTKTPGALQVLGPRGKSEQTVWSQHGASLNSGCGHA